VSVTALPSHVQELAVRVASGHGVEVLELSLRGQGRGRVLRVVLDAEEPVEADVVELVSKELSRALDADDPVAGSYTLEVSTPGLGRPLQTGRDFRRQRGHEVTVVRTAPHLGGAAATEGGAEVSTDSIEGVVVDADDEVVVLDVGGTRVTVPLSEVVRGKVVLPW
jgi:ribosome maturation factor RimP